MVLISLSPFLSKRMLVLLFAVLALSALSCLAESPLFSVSATPYDHQMSRIQPVLTSSTAGQKEAVSINVINRWMSNLREIPYGYSMQWRTPSEVAHDPVADCKGKAVALYEQMRGHGVHDVRLVIGKRAPTSRVTHTWVEWTDGSRAYVLDPTFNRCACPASDMPSSSYVAYYAFDGARKFRAASVGNLYAKL
jgi:predicted transglutaminase-like cysteine proteinase